MAAAIRPTTKLVAICHASQVLGTAQPVVDIGRVRAEHGAPLLLHTTQSASQVPVRLTASAIASTSHKALLGPSGIDGLVVSPALRIASTCFGGTGVESESLTHTQSSPPRLEAGTINPLDIIGLSESLACLQAEGMDIVHQREMSMIHRLREDLAALPGVAGWSSTAPIRVARTCRSLPQREGDGANRRERHPRRQLRYRRPHRPALRGGRLPRQCHPTRARRADTRP